MKKISLFFVLFACSLTSFAATYTIQMSKLDIADSGSSKTPVTFTAGDISISSLGNTSGGYGKYMADTKDFRLYAGCTLTISCAKAHITTLSFAISEKGKERLTDILPDVGTATVTNAPSAVWSGNANSVTFTIGDKATYGTDGATKNGQFFFTAMTITTDADISVGDSESGEVICEDCNYDNEPHNVVNFDETMTQATCYADAEGAYLYMSNAQHKAHLYFYGSLENNMIPTGNYAFNEDGKNNTFLASPGGDSERDYESVFIAGVSAAPFYMIDGSVQVSKSESDYTITVNATSYYGSTIKLSYTGAVGYEETAIRTVDADLTEVYARDGTIYGADAMRIYTINGMDVTQQNGSLQHGVYVVRIGAKTTKVVL